MAANKWIHTKNCICVDACANQTNLYQTVIIQCTIIKSAFPPSYAHFYFAAPHHCSMFKSCQRLCRHHHRRHENDIFALRQFPSTQSCEAWARASPKMNAECARHSFYERLFKLNLITGNSILKSLTRVPLKTLNAEKHDETLSWTWNGNENTTASTSGQTKLDHKLPRGVLC